MDRAESGARARAQQAQRDADEALAAIEAERAGWEADKRGLQSRLEVARAAAQVPFYIPTYLPIHPFYYHNLA